MCTGSVTYAKTCSGGRDTSRLVDIAGIVAVLVR
jgi:hypothetical protein